MAQTFQRILTPGVQPGAGMYTLEGGRAMLGCPVCGERFILPPGTSPDGNGKTNHQVQCPGCPWLDWAVLADHWEEVLR